MTPFVTFAPSHAERTNTWLTTTSLRTVARGSRASSSAISRAVTAAFDQRGDPVAAHFAERGVDGEAARPTGELRHPFGLEALVVLRLRYVCRAGERVHRGGVSVRSHVRRILGWVGLLHQRPNCRCERWDAGCSGSEARGVACTIRSLFTRPGEDE